MKYYSEITKKFYTHYKEAIAAEKEYEQKVEQEEKKRKELAEARKTRAAEVQEAYEALVAAEKFFNEKKLAFIKDFGSFHMTWRV